MKIPFNEPYLTGNEATYIGQALAEKHLVGNGSFTAKCHRWMQETLGSPKALLTPSCTAALEMTALLANIKTGDEIIMPSYTFVSSANAFVLRGGVPVFVDIKPDTINIDETKIEQAITSKTKAIVVVHYAGVACEMDEILAIAKRHKLLVIEDAAHAILAKYKGRFLGTLGDLSTLSFHATKNIISGEGGALIINDRAYIERSEIIWEKGTDRSKFFRGLVDKYTWVDIGSSYLAGEITAAFLFAQLERAEEINALRMKIWNEYLKDFGSLAASGKVQIPFIPSSAEHNAHAFYLVFSSLELRTKFIATLREKGIGTVFHYIPLHSSPAGRQYGRTSGSMEVTDKIGNQLVRLPLSAGMSHDQVQRVVSEVTSFCKAL